MDWEQGFGRWFGGRHGGPPRRHFHGRGGWDRFMNEPGPRAERGAVRYLVLDAIEKQPRHGYEIMQAITERSGGAYKPSPGVIYPTLQMLEEIGHVRATEKDERRVYAITADGKKDLDEHRDDVEDFYARSDGDDFEEYADQFAELATRAAKLIRLFRRAARHGHLRPSTMRALRGVLDDTMARIEQILGGD